ncbi:3' exoribonuclease family, domain 1-domain-containing protein [Panaeolus papilionaceus]|nr:3' exoribonuclease family, domain 1-domain-containing protein [Panaeolus papilionaceus]
MVSVFGPREAKIRSHTFHDRANLNVEVSVAPFSTGDRRKRSRGDKRLLEFAATVKSTFEPVVQTNLYPRSQIDIFIHVMQQDGGLLQAGINATTLALMNAGIPMIDFVCAITSGVHSTSPLLDLTTLEENDVPNMTLAMMPKTQKISLVTMETRLHVDRFSEIVKLATEAGLAIHREMKVAIIGRAKVLTESLESGNRQSGSGMEVEEKHE